MMVEAVSMAKVEMKSVRGEATSKPRIHWLSRLLDHVTLILRVNFPA